MSKKFMTESIRFSSEYSTNFNDIWRKNKVIHSFKSICLIYLAQVTFTPHSRGKHRVYVYLHGMEVKGSPFSLRIGKDVREPRKQATDIFKADRKVSRYGNVV